MNEAFTFHSRCGMIEYQVPRSDEVASPGMQQYAYLRTYTPTGKKEADTVWCRSSADYNVLLNAWNKESDGIWQYTPITKEVQSSMPRFFIAWKKNSSEYFYETRASYKEAMELARKMCRQGVTEVAVYGQQASMIPGEPVVIPTTREAFSGPMD